MVSEWESVCHTIYVEIIKEALNAVDDESYELLLMEVYGIGISIDTIREAASEYIMDVEPILSKIGVWHTLKT